MEKELPLEVKTRFSRCKLLSALELFEILTLWFLFQVEKMKT